MSYDDVQQNPWTRPGFIAAALVVAIVLALGTILAIRGGNTDAPPPPSTGGEPTGSPETEAPSAEPAEPAGDPSVCGLGDVALEGTVTQPPEAQWSLVGTTAVPFTEGAGPGVIEESGLRYCFARTPEGALLAAANILATAEEPSIRQAFIEHSVAAGPGRDAFLQMSDDSDAAQVRVQTAGFNILEYTGDAATVDVAIRVSNGTVGAVALSLVWEQGDWRVRFRENGMLWNLPVQLPDLTGYIPWSGV